MNQPHVDKEDSNRWLIKGKLFPEIVTKSRNRMSVFLIFIYIFIIHKKFYFDSYVFQLLPNADLI